MSRSGKRHVPIYKPGKCNVCGKIFARKHTVEEHIRDIHTSGKKITCTVENCNYKTNRVGNFNLHLVNKHNIILPVVKCYSNGCGKTSRSEIALIKHMRKCKGNPDFKTIKCPHADCKEEFLTLQGLDTHIKLRHTVYDNYNYVTKYKLKKQEIEELLKS